MRKRWVALGLLLAAALTAQAKPLVCCADAGPEGFDPSLWDSASTVRKDVRGFVMAPNGSVDFEGVYRE